MERLDDAHEKFTYFKPRYNVSIFTLAYSKGASEKRRPTMIFEYGVLKTYWMDSWRAYSKSIKSAILLFDLEMSQMLGIFVIFDLSSAFSTSIVTPSLVLFSGP